MNIKNKFLSSACLVFLLFMAGTSCKKLDRPALGDYPKDDQVLPAGDLRFFVPFDLAGDQFRFRVADSISGNPAFYSTNPLSIIPGVKDSAIKGEESNAIMYLNANDFASSKSFTVSFWEKNTVPTGGQPQFVFSLPDKDYWHNSGMFLLFDHEQAGSTSSEAVVKFAVEDHWFEFTPANGRMPGNLLDNNWHHLAFVYDAATSKMSYYVDGQLLTGLSPVLTDFLDNGVPHGGMNLKKESVANFVLGGWNKHVGISGPTDDWIQSWKGSLDQFRLYNKALSASEVLALYNSKL
jgi:hypothetical protein